MRRIEAGRLSVFCQEVPYPPNHGGKLDLWNLLRGLHDQGQTIQLLCWFRKGEGISPDVGRELARVATDVVQVRRRDGWWRVLQPKYPPRMLAFKPRTSDFAALKNKIQTFAPDWLLLDHWLAFLTARRLSHELRRPLVYRSQNVEHRYYREMQLIARGSLKIKLALNNMRLFAAEREIRSSVDLVADISAEDKREWEALGAPGNALVIRPLWLDQLVLALPSAKRDIDLLFVGNLRTPNNVEGLRWFTEGVLPILRSQATNIARIVFAGSHPEPSSMAFWRGAGVHCITDPPVVSTLYSRARAVINPLQRGSGVSLKMIEAFASGRPVVATSVAMRGLPEELHTHFAVCSTQESFASAVLDILGSPEPPVDPILRAALVTQYFGPGNLQALLAAVELLVGPKEVASVIDGARP